MLSTTTVNLSQLLGYSSIACWLCAQFPQVVENIKRQSCEGLALPFLANWFLGDVSNLIGCILTHQLPFQTYLAVYFVFVDISLVVQYLYYSTRTIPTYSHPHPHPHHRVSVSRSQDRGAARYRTLSAVAANVAASAALAAQQDEHVHRRWTTHTDNDATSDDNIDENALAALADSFHSESGHEARRKNIAWSIERYRRRSGSLGGAFAARQSSAEDVLNRTAHRGRPLERDGPGAVEIEIEPDPPSRRHSRKRSAGTMVFLAVWALFGVGTFNQRRAMSGTVLSARGYNTEEIGERVVGRIFAWLCTTLYLTSRLPQIWKNYVRKSVEGLSMYLFVFAFLGNLFYVASILTSPDLQKPPPESTAFLTESIPYLLGSGGTLMFDVTIVSQSFIYRPRARRHSMYSRISEEDSGVLGE